MSDTTFAHTFPSDRSEVTAANRPRRTTHGSGGWTLPSGLGSLRQPQDGALTNGVSNSSAVIRPINKNASSAGLEAEDARLNGSLRSLARRVKGLNVMSARPAEGSKVPAVGMVEALLRKAPEPNRTFIANRAQVA
jgi:hypothetical protein